MTDTPLEPADIKIPYDQFQISAIIGWIESNGYKPHLHIHPQHSGTRLPPASMTKEMEVINVATSAVHKLQWFDDRLEFNARFGGRDHRLVVPYHAIKAIGFAGTGTLVSLPWSLFREVGAPENPPASPAENPHELARDSVEEAASPTHENSALPTTSEIKLDAPVVEVSNVRTVDFRAPRKPKP